MFFSLLAIARRSFGTKEKTNNIKMQDCCFYFFHLNGASLVLKAKVIPRVKAGKYGLVLHINKDCRRYRTESRAAQ